MESETEFVETNGGTHHEISSEDLSQFILGATCTASVMCLSHESEPYGHGAVAFLMAKSLFKSLETNCHDAPRCLIRFNDTTCKLTKFIPWTLLNTELYRRSGLLDGWNEATFGLLLAASVPTALAVTELKENHFKHVVNLVNGVNLLALGYLASKQQNYWGLGMTAVCALDSFCLGKTLEATTPEMETENECIETNSGAHYEIYNEDLSQFILGTTCTASLMRLSHESEPYGHGAIAFLMAKSLFKSLETNCRDSPRSLILFNETTCKLAKFIPWTLLNMELYRRSGLLDGWNETTYGFLLAASLPTALAATQLKEKYFKHVVNLVNGVNLLALGYLASKQQNYWGLGMTAVCALDSFCLRKVARCVRMSEPNTRNVLRGFFAGMLPFYLKSL